MYRHLNTVLALTALVASSGATSLAALESDDFDRANLDTTRWTFVDPLDDGWLEMQGAGTADARLALSVPEGASHDPWHVNRAVRAMAPTSDADFQTELRFLSAPVARYQMQGFVVEQDADDWIRFDVLHDGVSQRIFAGTTVGGSSSPIFNVAIADGAAEFMRITRIGDGWTLEIAGSDTVFTTAGSFNHALEVTAAGLFVANHASSGLSPAFTTMVDYVFDTAAPIVPEDGAVEPDTLPPLIHALDHVMGVGELIVSWRTDEPSSGLVMYGTTTAYEMGTVPSTGLATAHEVTLPGLTPGITYHYRVCAEDAGERESCTGDVEMLFDPSGPVITLWYGLEQPFGAKGQPQPWANVLGHVSDPDGITSLSYTLDGGSPVPLSIGPDGRRLENPGDFNVDIATADLVEGANTVVVTAIDGAQNESVATVTIDYTGGTTWPLPTSIDWSLLESDEEIQEVAQVVDGKWHLEGGTIRTTEPGYDRLVAVGDSAWTDYEFLVPVTLSTTPGGFGAGVLLRWNGHTDTPVSCDQPMCGYLPLGGILWLRSGRLEIYGNDGIIYDSASMSVQPGVTYWLRGRVETTPSGGVYSAKAWPDGQGEPAEWQVVGEGDLDDPTQGSLLLISHEADATFGMLNVTALQAPSNLPPIAADDLAYVAPGDSVDVAVLANDTDPDGVLDPTSVVLASGPFAGSASVDALSGVITYRHDGSPTDADSLVYTVRDDDGDASNEAVLRIVVSSDPPPHLVSDDFNRCVLDGDRWTLVNPLGDGTAATVGAGSGDAYLTLSLPAGTPHDAWGPGGLNETVRVMQVAQDTDFRIDVGWSAEPSDGYDDQGILVQQDADTWLRFDVYHTGSELKLFVGRTIGGANTTLLNATIPDGSASHLRVSRTGDTWRTSTSADGTAWDERHLFTQVLVVNAAGVYAGNPIGALAFTSEVDYFLVASDPLADEDGAVNEIAVEIVGEGSVIVDPDLPAYACDDVVDLTADADPGWTFTGWSGDLEGTANPATLVVTGRMSVTATFSEPVAVEEALPVAHFAVLSASPSPSSGPTSIRFRLAVAASVGVEVVDVTGRLVRRLGGRNVLPPGVHAVTWDGRTASGARVAPGVYFAIVGAGSHSEVVRFLRLE